MILHHFAPSHALNSIRRHGLTRGALPWNRDPNGTPVMRYGFQWLTSNPDFAQPFALMGSLPFPKNAWRITVAIPPGKEKQLFKWSELCRRCRPDCEAEVNTPAVDWQNWWVFLGPLKPETFIEVSRNGGELLTGALDGPFKL